MQYKQYLRSRFIAPVVIILCVLLIVPQLAVYARANTIMTDIDLGDLVLEEFTWDDMTHLYSFMSAQDQPTMLVLESLNNERGAGIRLQDVGTGEMIAEINNISTGMCLRLPAGRNSYVLEIQANDEVLIPYWAMTWPVGEGEFSCSDTDIGNMVDSATVTAILADGGGVIPLLDGVTGIDTSTPIDMSGPADCRAVSGSALNVNVRNQPSTRGAVIGSLSGEVTGTVLNTLETGVWLNIDNGGETGWVATSVVNLEGNCGNIPVVNFVEGQLLAVPNVTLDVNALLGTSGILLDADASVGSGGINVDADAPVGSGGINVDADASAGIGVDADASVGDGVDADVSVGGDGGIGVDADVSVGGDDGGGLDIEIDLGL